MVLALCHAMTVGLVAVLPTGSWLSFVEDADIVAKSDVLVLGRMKANSIEFIASGRRGDDTWFHTAVLEVEMVVKGDLVAKEIRIAFVHGIVPVVDGVAKREEFAIDLRSTLGVCAPSC